MRLHRAAFVAALLALALCAALAVCGCHRPQVAAAPPPPPPAPMMVASAPPEFDVMAESAAPSLSSAETGPVKITPAVPAPAEMLALGSAQPSPQSTRGSRAIHGQSAAAASGSVDEAEEAWFAGLKQSNLKWDVPPVMALNQQRLMTVRIFGYQDSPTSADALPNATGGSTLRVSSQMSAEMVSASGDDLTVAPLDANSQKYVPADGFTDWSWNVTPIHSGKNKMLRLTVDVIMDTGHRRQFVTYSKPFAVEVVSATTARNYGEDHFWSILKYWGPGGAGFLAAAGLIQWWRKRSQSKGPAAPSNVG